MSPLIATKILLHRLVIKARKDKTITGAMIVKAAREKLHAVELAKGEKYTAPYIDALIDQFCKEMPFYDDTDRVWRGLGDLIMWRV